MYYSAELVAIPEMLNEKVESDSFPTDVLEGFGMLLRHVRSILSSCALCLVLTSCMARAKHAAIRSPETNSLSGFPSILPVSTITKKIHRRYVNYAGAEAFIFSYQNQTSVLTRWNDSTPFQFVPFASATDPVVLPLPNGQTIVASKDQILLRHGCTDFACAFSEIIKAPTNNPPTGLNAVPTADGPEPQEVVMVNGSSSIYTLNLLKREWRTSDNLPVSSKAVAIKSTADTLFVLDQYGKHLLMKATIGKEWHLILVPTEADERLQGITVANGYLVLSSGSKIRAASLQQLRTLVDTHQPGDQIKWHDIAPPDTNAILQVSANDAKLFCTTVLGDTFQLDAGNLSMTTIGNGWSMLSPTSNVQMGGEQIQNAAEVEGEVLAFTSSGVVHSTDDGKEWIREKADENKLRRMDEVAYATRRYAITADTLLKKDGPNEAWQSVQPSTGLCGSSSYSDNRTLRGDRLLKIDNRKLLLIYKLGSTGPNVGCIFDTQVGSIEALTKGWQLSTSPAIFVAVHGVLFAATRGGVKEWLSSEHRWEDFAETTNSHGDVLPNDLTAAAPYGSNGIIVATSSGKIYHSDFTKGCLSNWVPISDNSVQLMSYLAQNHSRIVSIWVNPERLSEIYLLLNQNGTTVFTRDKTDTSFLFAYVNPQDPPVGFVRTSDGTLLTFGVNQINRIISNRPLPGSFGDYRQRFGDKIQNWLKEPISWITAFVGTYLIAVLCILALRYLPPNPVLGRNWLASFVVKPLTMIPLSGRWILFLGYRRRVSRALKRDTPYFGLPMDLPSGEKVATDGSSTKLLEIMVKQLNNSQQVVITGRPGSGKSMLLERIAQKLSEPGFKERKWLPVLITSDDYNGDLIESASKVLKERFGIPLDKEDVLLAQMQVGKLLFLLDGLSEISTSRTAAVVDLQRVTKMPEFAKCALLIATRPFKGAPGFPECKIQPVKGQEAIDNFLPLFSLEDLARDRAKKNLLGFGDDPIDVQLLAMTIEASSADITQHRHEIFVSFFRKRLSAEGDECNDRWDGWRLALELIAKSFCIDTGVRSVGLSPRLLIGSIEETNPAFGKGADNRSLLNELRDVYGVDYTSGSALLEYLKTAGLLIRTERWKFAHDTFEEFFCASFLVRKLKIDGYLPDLGYWRTRPQEFQEVFEFVREMADKATMEHLSQEDLTLIGKDSG